MPPQMHERIPSKYQLGSSLKVKTRCGQYRIERNATYDPSAVTCRWCRFLAERGKEISA